MEVLRGLPLTVASTRSPPGAARALTRTAAPKCLTKRAPTNTRIVRADAQETKKSRGAAPGVA
eukprot:scaffold649112_cov39-Prasinocladus_malaysianus.AAC.1